MAVGPLEETKLTNLILRSLGSWLAKVRDAVRRAWLRLSGRLDVHVISSTEPLWIRLVGDIERELRIIAEGEYESVAGKGVPRQTQLIEQALQESHNLLVRIPNEIQARLQSLISAQVAAGKTTAEIEAAVQAFLDATGSENWAGRAKKIAVTEVHRMANAGIQAAGMAISNTEATSLTKTWITRHDDRVRTTHAEADGQTVPLHGVFSVGDSLMLYPGDPMAPAYEVINCRCSMKINDRKAA